MKQAEVVFIVNLIVLLCECSCQTINPCPEIFRYQTDGKINYGIITVPPSQDGKTTLEVELDGHGTKENYSEGLQLLKSSVATLEDIKNGQNIQYKLNFSENNEIWPTLTKITLNGRDICRGTKVLNVPKLFYTHILSYSSSYKETVAVYNSTLNIQSFNSNGKNSN